MKTIRFADGTEVPALGQGTWHMGERGSDRAAEARALSLGLDLGMSVIDTAEMYANGGAEEVVAEAIRGRRDDAFLVSKVLPYNASRRGTVDACEASLRRMGVGTIDLYLLHWPGSHPLEETVSAFETLVAQGKIRRYGVSNFDTAEMHELWSIAGGGACQTNQILYNLSRRGPEFDLMPACAGRGVPIMAYSPLEQGRLARDATLASVAARHGVSPLQVALAWTLRRDDVLSIPKTATVDRVRENRAAADLVLTAEDLAELDQGFPAPTSRRSLEIL
jgi:diketogulonate reductase-like aldo/keto reductase